MYVHIYILVLFLVSCFSFCWEVFCFVRCFGGGFCFVLVGLWGLFLFCFGELWGCFCFVLGGFGVVFVLFWGVLGVVLVLFGGALGVVFVLFCIHFISFFVISPRSNRIRIILYRSIWHIDRILTLPSQSRTGSNNNERIFHTPQIFRTIASPSNAV